MPRSQEIIDRIKQNDRRLRQVQIVVLVVGLTCTFVALWFVSVALSSAVREVRRTQNEQTKQLTCLINVVIEHKGGNGRDCVPAPNQPPVSDLPVFDTPTGGNDVSINPQPTVETPSIAVAPPVQRLVPPTPIPTPKPTVKPSPRPSCVVALLGICI